MTKNIDQLKEAILKFMREHAWAVFSTKEIAKNIGYNKPSSIAYVRQGMYILEQEKKINRVNISKELKEPYHHHRTILFDLNKESV